MQPTNRALIFDCDGALADTELNGHLVAFNQMWRKLGVAWKWSPEQYAQKLRIAGGKERMATLFQEEEFRRIFAVPDSEEDHDALIASWHKEKTDHFVGSHSVKVGRQENRQAALAAGWRLAVASTSANLRSRRCLFHTVGKGTAKRFTSLAGDIVAAKKPAADIHFLTVKKLGIPPKIASPLKTCRPIPPESKCW